MEVPVLLVIEIVDANTEHPVFIQLVDCAYIDDEKVRGSCPRSTVWVSVIQRVELLAAIAKPERSGELVGRAPCRQQVCAVPRNARLPFAYTRGKFVVLLNDRVRKRVARLNVHPLYARIRQHYRNFCAVGANIVDVLDVRDVREHADISLRIQSITCPLKEKRRAERARTESAAEAGKVPLRGQFCRPGFFWL